MSRKKSFFILILGLKILNLQAQGGKKAWFKPHISQTTNMGMVIPIGHFANNNNFGFHSATVVEADVTPHFFARITWDFFQLRYVQKITIGHPFIVAKSKNNGNAFYLSGGYKTSFKQWNYYTFAGAGLTLLNDPKLTTTIFDHGQYTYLSNQNSKNLSINWGFGVGHKLSSKEQVKIEINFFQLPFNDSISYLSFQLGYHLYLNNPKNTLFLSN
jgi:hypothetical protein